MMAGAESDVRLFQITGLGFLVDFEERSQDAARCRAQQREGIRVLSADLPPDHIKLSRTVTNIYFGS